MEIEPQPNPDVVLDGLSSVLKVNLDAELVPGERILWAASAPPFHFVTPESTGLGRDSPLFGFLCAIGLVVGGVVSIAFPLSVDRKQFPLDPISFGVLFILVGSLIGISSIRDRIRAQRRIQASSDSSAQNFFALTDRRAIFWMVYGPENCRSEIHSLRPGEFHRIYRVEHPEGLGDVIFEIFPARDDEAWDTLCYSRIADVRRVEELARRILLRYDTPSPD